MSYPKNDSQSNADEILVSNRGEVAVLSLNRPSSANALTSSMAASIFEQLEILKNDPEVSAIVITGVGKTFSAGGDIEELQRWQRYSAYERQTLLVRLQKAALTWAEFPKLTVAAVNGVAAGAGLDLLLGSDIAIAGESVYFVSAFSKIGLIPDLGGTWLFPKLIGLARSKWLMLTNEKIDAKQALEWGMIAKVVPDDEVLEQAVLLAKQITSTVPKETITELKQLLAVGSGSLAGALTDAATSQSLLIDTKGHQKLIAEFLARRK
ncbi:MAG: enoyl-CoA hydratase/isomerase family protein [Actinobacteria bacterium]|jgi:2-(1,2-epoxy-1,2-dihydrophenyl)acetyl-CoA isomerase|nr:enoyl-CoA hydratase/isomerase family protein [Actinomycetota bacterium]MCL6104578.1 enoyl-CoA hydratase/isomerase family protein [Actinomycetota bacterium]